MKLLNLARLVEAAELGLSLLDADAAQARLREALHEAYEECRRRQLQSKGARPARTVTRTLIRAALARHYKGVRLRKNGEWHVQLRTGASWMPFASNDLEAQEELLVLERKCKVLQECGCVTPHSSAVGVVEACLAGKLESQRY